MKSLFIEKVAKMESPVFLSYNKKNALLTELVSLASAETVNVHSPEYMKVSEIIACYELVTGEKFSKSFIKSHKREDFIMIAIDAINVLEAAAQNSNKPEEVNEMDLAKESVIVGKEMGNSGLPKPVGYLSTSDYLPLYNKEENCDIEPKDDVDNSLPELPVLTEDQARTLMTKLIRHASNNIVKCFISKHMVESVITKELFGHTLKSKPLQQYSKEDFAVGKAAAAQLLQVGLTPYKSGFLIKPFCMAGAYKNSLIKYRAKNNTIYVLNTRDKTITNMATGEIVDATKKNCSYFDNADLVGIDKIA